MITHKRHFSFPALVILSLLVSLTAAKAQDQKNKNPTLVVQTGHTSDVYSVAFSPDGKMLASGSLDNTVKLWDVQTGRELKTFSTGADAGNTVFCVAFSPDGKTLASAGSRETTIKLWDVMSGQLLRTLNGHTHYVMSVAFSPDGRTLASGSWDDTVRLWNVQTGEPIAILGRHASDVYSVVFSPDGRFLASGGLDDVVKLWDVKARKEWKTLPGKAVGVHSVAFSPDGKIVAAATRDRAVRLWDVASGNQLKPFTGHTYSVSSLAFSPDGKILAAAEGFKTVRLWDVTSGQGLQPLTGPKSAIHSIRFSPNGQTLASGSGNAIKLWDVQTKQELRTMVGHTAPVLSVAFSPDGGTIAIGSTDKTVRLWELKTGRRLNVLSGMTGEIWSVAFSPDGVRLASLEGSLNKTVRLWDVNTGQELKTLSGHTAFAFSPDGKTFASGAPDKTIRLWDMQTGQELKPLAGSTSPIQSITFSPDGGTLASGGYKIVRLWDVRAGRELQPLVGHDDIIWTIAFSPDGKTFATGSEDQTVILWDLPTRQVLRKLPERGASVWSVAFSPDGKKLASRSGTDRVTLSDVTSGREDSFERDDLDTTRRVQAMVPALYQNSRYEPVTLDGRFQIKPGDNSRLNLYDVQGGELIASLITLDERDWVAVMPDGRFDTDKNLSNNIEGLHWIFPDRPLTPLPFNIFLRDYYEPRLLSRLLKGVRFPPLPSLAELNRLQPQVGGIMVIPRPNNPDVVDVKVYIESVAGRCARGNKQVPCESGVYDLRLYRDGQLVGQSPGPEPRPSNSGLSKHNRLKGLQAWRRDSIVKTGTRRHVTATQGRQQITFSNIRLPQRPDVDRVEFTAYAFNEDRVKSETSLPTAYTPAPPQAAMAARRAYLVTVGVDATAARNWRLLFAPNGARDIERLLADRLRPKYEVVPIQLISEFQDDGLSFKQNTATKSNIQAVLAILAGFEVEAARRELIPGQEKLRAAMPDDLVIIYVASHGYAAPEGRFYLIPSDLDTSAENVSETLLNRCLTRPERSEGCRAASSFIKHSISSEELTEWMRAIDAGEMTLVIDSCHSAAISGRDFKPGPMGDRSFGQLSYDKGMRVLAATQAENEAWGTLGLHDRSLLTYVLTRAASEQPFDMETWLGEAERAVPELYKKHLGSREQPPQEPVFFDFVKN